MGKLRCICGHNIVDQTDNISYKGYILSDTCVDEVSDILTDNIDSLIEANNKNERLDWIKKNFIVPPYPIDLKDSAMIHDLLSSKLIEKTQDIFECEKCGRIAIQVGLTNKFSFYNPDSDKSKGILDSKK
ncbi:hypothetical protein [Flavobacterium sp. ASW18X]|uniref:hypothetical protein n=1 Tax=Flavobacterium sp. ASW18X TaxID=2572595 RepID=UPI0010ADBC3B|nr:hypothetical protein [Flavobacterium sp. ASW18X]TKD54273.1 hypothetical protein FBT53_15960 [Flavobacterium sp. ASW18X]